MVSPELLAEAAFGVPAALAALSVTTSGVRYVMVDRHRKAAFRCSWRVRATWKKTAMRVGLFQMDKAAKVGEAIPLASQLVDPKRQSRTLIPYLRVSTDSYGLVIKVKVIGQIGLEAWQKACPHLTHAWKVRQVTVEELRPGWLKVRAMLRDPLTEALDFDASGLSGVDLESWEVGIDSYGQRVTLRSSGVSGGVVAGLAGYGKTVLLNARISTLAVSAAVQFVFIDGKGGPDYDDLFCRAWMFCKDNPEEVRTILSNVHTLMTERQAAIRPVLGVKNMWHVGPSKAWPLVVVVIDEAHTFFREIKGRANEKRNAVNAEIAWLVEELVRKGRNVGIQIILATQKATGDAIPTYIRDNCQVAVSFAQRTSEAAIATLGSDISDYPYAHPRKLVDPAYIGVASMQVEGRPGFTLVRTPYASDELAAQIATRTAHLTASPLDLLHDQINNLSIVVPGDLSGIDNFAA